MRHVAHLVRTDVRRFRLLLAAWVLIQIADAVIRGTSPALVAEQRLAVPLALLASVLYALGWLGTIVIVPLVVQMHPLVGSDAFWMTRPIHWGALLTSKVLLLGLALVAVPIVCDVCLMAAFRTPPADVFQVALHTALLQSLLLSGLMTLSAATANLARFALTVGSVLVGIVLLLNLLLALAIRTLSEGPEVSVVTVRSAQSAAPVVMMLVLLSAAAIGLVIVQYRTRSRLRSVGAGLAGLGVTVLVALFWPSRSQPLPVPDWAAPASALQLIGESRQGEFRSYDQPTFFGQASVWQMGGVRARIRGVEHGWLTTARLAESVIEFDDGARLTSAGNGYQSTVYFEGAEESPLRIVMRDVLAVDRINESANGRYGAVAIQGIVVSDSTFRAYSGRTGTYRGRFLVDLEQVRIVAVLPLEAGAAFHDRGIRLVIDQVVAHERTVAVKVREFATRTLLDGGAFPRLSFYLRNRGRSEAAAGSMRPGMIGQSIPVGLPVFFGYGASHSSATPGIGFSVTAGFVQFPESFMMDRQVIDLTAAWLSGAELVILRIDAAGSVERSLEIPGFQIAQAPRESPQ